MMVGWLSMAEMSKSMFSMIACRHARDGHALMEVLAGDGRGKATLSSSLKRASVAFMRIMAHTQGLCQTEHDVDAPCPVRPPAPDQKRFQRILLHQCNAGPCWPYILAFPWPPWPLCSSQPGNQPIICCIP